jgi:hypothetical protein
MDKNILGFFAFFSLIPLFTSGQLKKNISSDVIYWSKDYKLQWKDYRAKNSNDYNKNNIAAETVYRIEYGNKYRRNDTLCLDILTVFLKKESFYEPNYINSIDTIFSQEALQHERIHFDIAELYARKLRKDIIKRLNKFKYKKSDYVMYVIGKLYDKETSECNVQQALLDKETDIGKSEREALSNHKSLSNEDRIKMAKNLTTWRKKIDDDLQELEEYSNTTINIKVRKII